MNQTMREAFRTGSGADPATFKTTLTLIVSAVVLTFFAWIVMQLMDAYRHERVTAVQATIAGVKAMVLLSLVLYVVV
ncbi:DUF3262 family protein [Acidovorax sp. SUPP2539]|uniref:DUF3262 family protein n=1 Tax=Acidovorax sp. SUPP2539 TaxID=2920878 RepID=UPI0023DE4504|nr:DUF3262 family protein [Acidovorax sp. SUPP2539]GKS92645.1 DUF3262 family protein [Acidovorax sp. SUPP2539]